MPEGWRLRLAPAHALDLEQECELAAPLTATSLIAALVGFALALDAYLERPAPAGVAAPAISPADQAAFAGLLGLLQGWRSANGWAPPAPGNGPPPRPISSFSSYSPSFCPTRLRLLMYI